jgi:transcriptional regulator with XRE-family HTH domain
MGERLKQARDRLVLTQKELADRAGVEVMVVSRIERGAVTKPYPSTVRKLAAALGVSPAWLRFGDDDA